MPEPGITIKETLPQNRDLAGILFTKPTFGIPIAYDFDGKIP